MKMQMSSNDGEFESNEEETMKSVCEDAFTNLRSMRVLRMSPIRTETGGIKRLNKKIDWETLVDALYAPKSRFSKN